MITRVMGQCGDHVRCQDTRHCHETGRDGDNVSVTQVGVFKISTTTSTTLGAGGNSSVSTEVSHNRSSSITTSSTTKIDDKDYVF